MNADIRQVFHKWDCSLIESEELFAELRNMGLEIREPFITLVTNHKRIRNLAFSLFLKVLKQGQVKSMSEDLPKVYSDVSPSKFMNAVIFRDIPVSSSAKAPFGTDNNMFLNPLPARDALTAEIMATVFPSERKRMGPVAGAHNVFEETVSDCGSSSPPSEGCLSIPRHLKSTMNPITGEQQDPADSVCGVAKRRVVQEDHGDILSWKPDESVCGEDLCRDSKRHYPPPSVTYTEEPDESVVSYEAMEYAKNLSRDGPIAHLPEQPPPQSYRRLTKNVSSKPKSFCPFATDSDDLTTMRKIIRQKPLGSVSAPIPVNQFVH